MACDFCGLLNDDADFANTLNMRLQAGHMVSNPNDGFGFDICSLRSVATRFRRFVVPDSKTQRLALQNPHSELAAGAYLRDLNRAPGDAITLAVMCRERAPVIAHNAVHLGWASELVVLVNTDDQKPEQQVQDRTRIVTRAFSGDFARQRNHLQDLCSTPWVLQLDADETLSTETAALLPALAAVARGDGWCPSALAGKHDTLHGAIDHYLTLAHVQSQSMRYEALDPGRGRLDEADALMRPFCE